MWKTWHVKIKDFLQIQKVKCGFVKVFHWYFAKVILYLWDSVEYVKVNAPVAQPDRALDSGSKGWGFDSLRAHARIMPKGIMELRRFKIQRIFLL